MNKSELIDAVHAETQLSKADVKKALESFLKQTAEALKKRDKLTLVGFGSFSTVTRKERMGRNPQTRQEMKIEAKTVVKFKPGAELNKDVQ